MNRSAKLLCAMLAGAGLCIAPRAGADESRDDLAARDEVAAVGRSNASPRVDYSAYFNLDPPASSGGQMADESCDTCDLCDNGEDPNWGLTAGVEATYLRPRTHDLSNPSDDDDALFARNFVSLDGYEAAPRIWLGIESCAGNGLRARYWQYDAEDTFASQVFDDDFNVTATNANTNLEAYTVDLEYTRHGGWDCWDLLASFGARHASIARNESLSYFDQFNGVFAGTNVDSRFAGVGLTAALEAKRPFGPRSLSFVANARGSILWGRTKQNGISTLATSEVTGLQLAINEEDSTLWILEAQVGLEWTHDLSCCHGTVFARAVLEYQYWVANETAFELSQTIDGVTLAAVSQSPDVDFYGPSFSVGFTR